jgi:hypothetical protein
MKRISGYISDELYNSIEEIAERENRKFTPMITLLLQLAVKEKNRKRHAKKDNLEYSAGDMGKSNTTG